MSGCQNRRIQGRPETFGPVNCALHGKRLLGLTQCGNTTMAFMRDTLAPLIKPGMRGYEDLKRDIFGS